MISEATVLDIKLQMEVLITKRSKMAVENLSNNEAGVPITYSSEEYGELEVQFNALRETLIKLMGAVTMTTMMKPGDIVNVIDIDGEYKKAAIGTVTTHSETGYEYTSPIAGVVDSDDNFVMSLYEYEMSFRDGEWWEISEDVLCGADE